MSASERLKQARKDLAAANDAIVRQRFGEPLDLNDEELDRLSAVSTRDQQLALSHARKNGGPVFLALLQAVTEQE